MLAAEALRPRRLLVLPARLRPRSSTALANFALESSEELLAAKERPTFGVDRAEWKRSVCCSPDADDDDQVRSSSELRLRRTICDSATSSALPAGALFLAEPRFGGAVVFVVIPWSSADIGELALKPSEGGDSAAG